MPPKKEQQGEASSSKTHSRKSSAASQRHTGSAYVPTNPSGLRTVHVPSEGSVSPDEPMHPRPFYDDEPHASASAEHHHEIEFSTDGIAPAPDHASAHSDDEVGPPGGILDVDLEHTSARTRLLSHQNWDAASGCGDPNCNHGAMSPRPGTHRSYGSFASDAGFGGRYPGGIIQQSGEAADATHALLGDSFADGVLGGGSGPKMSTTRYLANLHGIKNQRLMYLAYYIPIINWAQQYKWRYLKGDFIAALTMASFYIPMALSYASNLGHLPPINGLYSFAINPLIYGILGSCPQMIVGPEAAGSLLTGEVVRENIKKGTTGDKDGIRNAEIAGIVTCMAGAFIFLAGTFRLGFLDNVLSRPFLRGFISAIGVVIFVDQLIPEMGLAHIAADQVSHGSCLDKIIFLVRNVGNAHGLTCAVSFGAFFIIMFFR
jgi:hypothetical protein